MAGRIRLTSHIDVMLLGIFALLFFTIDSNLILTHAAVLGKEVNVSNVVEKNIPERSGDEITNVFGSRSCAFLCHTEVGSQYCSCEDVKKEGDSKVELCSLLCSLGIPAHNCQCTVPNHLCFIYCSNGLNNPEENKKGTCNCDEFDDYGRFTTAKPPTTTTTFDVTSTTTKNFHKPPQKRQDLCQALCKVNLGGTLCECGTNNVIKRSVDQENYELTLLADMNYIHHDVCHVLCARGLGADLCDDCKGFNTSRLLHHKETSNNLASGNTDSGTKEEMCKVLCPHNEGGTVCNCDSQAVRRRKRETAALYAFRCLMPCHELISPRDRERCGCKEFEPHNRPNQRKLRHALEEEELEDDDVISNSSSEEEDQESPSNGQREKYIKRRST